MTTEHTLVIDTKLWMSRLLLPQGIAARAVDHGLSWGVPLVSEATLEELSDVLSRSKFDRYVSREDQRNFLRLLGGIARVIPVVQRITACRDPKDDKFLDVALNGGSGLILTGDHDLSVLHPFHGIEIVSPADFLQRRFD